MYNIQDRVHHLHEVLDHESLPVRQDILFCRSHGQDKLCDGFVCHSGSECQSGCCGTFGNLNQDYCQPIVDGVCPVAGFTYGPNGDLHYHELEEAHHEDEHELEEHEIVEPIEFKNSTLAETIERDVDEDKEKGSAFYNGVLIGIVAWVVIALVIVALYCCCCKKSSSSSVSDPNQYGELQG